MRKASLLAFLLLAWSSSFARQISPDEAGNIASEFFSSHMLQTRAGSTLSVSAVDNGMPVNPFYVFNAGTSNGFVIVSSDDRFPKILGYSDKGSFDFSNLPPQLNYLLGCFTERASQTDFEGIHPSWSTSFLPTRTEESVLLETAEWGQGAPYDALTPEFDGEHAPTGCVATAMAIVMKYHQWPATYDWDSMPMTIESDGENPPAVSPAIAQLMKDAGDAVHMFYGPSESGANMNWVGHRLQYTFHYSPDCQFISSDSFSDDDWLAMIKENLDGGNPVIYQGASEEGFSSHAFILDGYNSEGYHVNWGWDGWYNGYYALDLLSPNEYQDFSHYNSMVLNIVPDKTGDIYSECFMDKGYFYGASDVNLMNISVADVKKDEPFHVTNDVMTFPVEFYGERGIALVSKDNEIKEVLQTVRLDRWQTPGCDPFAGYQTNYTNLVVTSDIEPTDRIQYVTKREDENVFRLVLGTLENPSSIPVTGNTPRTANVKLNIAPGIYFQYDLRTDGLHELSEGSYEIKDVPLGLHFEFFCNPETMDSEHGMILSAKGKHFYGDDMIYASKGSAIGTFINILSDYEIDAKIVELTDKDITLDEAGSLSAKLAGTDVNAIRNLKVSGKMNALDFWFLRDNCVLLTSLDIKDGEIEAVYAVDPKFTQFDRHPENPANTIPEFGIPSLKFLQKVMLPDNLTAISYNSMLDLDLLSIDIPAGVNEIGLNAFSGNKNLIAVGLRNPEPVYIHDCVFADTPCPMNGNLYVPEGAVEKYAEAEVWKDFGSIKVGQAPADVKWNVKLDGLIYECILDKAVVTEYEGEPKDIVIPETVSDNGMTAEVYKIKELVFLNCQSIESVVMPNTITEIGMALFQNCPNLKSVKLSDKITYLPAQTFCNCPLLEELEIGPNISMVAPECISWTGLKSIRLHKDIIPEQEGASFYQNSQLTEYIVEEGNPYYESIDGLLYRKVENGLSLESVPGQKNGTLILPDNCVSVKTGAIASTQLKEIIFNENCKVIQERAVSNEELEHIVLPSSAVIHPSAFWCCQSLESVTVTGNLERLESIFDNCMNLKNILITSSEETINLKGIFEPSTAQADLNIFTSDLVKEIVYNGNCTIYVPGASVDSYTSGENMEIKEMWTYRLNRKEGILEIVPLIEGLVIDKVIVNGKVVVPENGLYHIEDSSTLDIIVDYNLLGCQPMTTHYTDEFNAGIEDAPLSGVYSIISDGEGYADIYTIDGALVLKAAAKTDVKNLLPGIYIIRKGNKSEKIIITE